MSSNQEWQVLFGVIPDSPGLMSGAILLPKLQYDAKLVVLRNASTNFNLGEGTEGLADTWERMWEPIRITATCTMYRYKNASLPWTGRVYTDSIRVEEVDELDVFWNEHNALVDLIQVPLTCGHQVVLFEGDSDEDFTYGAFLQALANINERDSDWVLTKEFGAHYAVRHIDILIDT